MAWKLIFKNCTLVALFMCSMTVYASHEMVKCPSVKFVQSKFPQVLNQVTRYCDLNKFDVTYYDHEIIFDEESQHHWMIDVFVRTSKESDYNEAYQLAENAISGIDRSDRATTDHVCLYLNKDGEESGVELYLYETNNLKMKKMSLRK